LKRISLFIQKLRTIQPILRQAEPYVRGLLHITSNMMTVEVIQANGESRKPVEYKCYYEWAAVHCILSYIHFLTSLNIDSHDIVTMTSPFYEIPDTREHLTFVLNSINKMKWYDEIDLDVISDIKEVLLDVYAAHQHPGMDSDKVDKFFKTAFSIPTPKSYVHMVKGVNNFLKILNFTWGSKANVALKWKSKEVGKTITHEAIVTPTLASHLSGLYTNMNKYIVSIILANYGGIPRKFKDAEVYAVKVNPKAIANPNEPMLIDQIDNEKTRKVRRKQNGGVWTSTTRLAPHQSNTNNLSVAQRTGTIVARSPFIRGRNGATNAKPTGVMRRKDLNDERQILNKPMIPNTLYSYDTNTDHHLIQLIITFFLQTDPILHDRIVNALYMKK